MNTPPKVQVKPSLFELFYEFLIIGAVSFGGGIVAYEKILLTEKKSWLNDDEFMACLSISQTLPGLNAVNVAVLVGDRLCGVWGSVVAALGLLLPGSTFVLAVVTLFHSSTDRTIANLLLGGVAAAATGLLSAITYRLGKKNFQQFLSLMIVIATFGLKSIVGLSLPTVLLIMGPIALFLFRPGA